MLLVAEVSARFAFTDGVAVTFSDTLEVSLDCCICHRCWRTVIFQVGILEGKCTPSGHAFPGKVISKKTEAGSVAYRLEYWYEPFEDAKYPGRKLHLCPTWGCIGFTVVCPQCGESQQCGAQNNAVLPWTCRCKCGHALYTEVEEMPVLSLVE